ncbi:MAG: exo-alpha-sialidase [Planctomycetaceae bacterium]|nr:exo-alpha-sialidase [Planctomycetaceae bacterium]
MLRFLSLSGLLSILLFSFAHAEERHWSCEDVDPTEFVTHGNIRSGAGVNGKSFVLDGLSLLKVRASEEFANAPAGFTWSVWVNPYLLNGEQQMLIAKNCYAKNQRQWGVMIDKDNKFRLYVWQGKWVTAEATTAPQPGHWHLVSVVVREDFAELWVNGNREGTVTLTKPIPQTEASVTFGGVDDNGRIWQNFVGALDEIQLVDRPLSAKELRGKFQMVDAVHTISDFAKDKAGVPLWDATAKLPKTADAEILSDVKFHVIKKWEPDVDGYDWLHGVALAWHKGALYASFGHNEGAENTLTEIGRYCVSHDGGQTWSPIRSIDVGTDSDDLAVSHGVFLSHKGTLWAFLGAFHNTRQRVHTRAYTLDETIGSWRPHGVVVEAGFWPMQEPINLENGNWLMSGLSVGEGNPAAIALSNGDNLTDWTFVEIPKSPSVGQMWGESTVLVDGKHITNIARYGQQAIALVAESDDFGATWTKSVKSNLPMVTSKPYSGMLSTGQRYLVCTTTADSGGRRSPLTIAVTRPGEKLFCKVFVIRHAVFPEGPGESHAQAKLSYPYAVEHEGKLYVGYSNSGERGANRNSAELAIIPVSTLATE